MIFENRLAILFFKLSEIIKWLRVQYNNIDEVIYMYNTNVTNARANLYNLINMAIDNNEIININTKNGNAVLISEEDYNALIETLYLSSDANYKKSLIDGMKTPLKECVDEEEIEW